MRFILALAALAAGCFQPKFGEHLACGPGGECPPGLTCAADGLCHALGDQVADAPAGSGDAPLADARRDAAVADARPDAAPPDAPPVGCQGDGDCAAPPDMCSKAGTCNLTTHECSFPPVTCTQLDTECTQGVCNPTNGACLAVPRNENAGCGAGTTCGAFGQCGGFADVCDETGVQSRTCTVFTCQAGTCAGTSMNDTATCTRGSTDGAVCGSASPVSCTACGGFSGTCDEDGQQTCTCVTPLCSGGTCSGGTSSTCVLGCSRDTDGLDCGNGHKCDAGSCVCTTC